MFRREQNSADTALKRDRRTINGRIRLLAQLSDALLTAEVSGGDIGIRQAWRRGIRRGNPDRRTYELCVLVELRVGDIWVEGSRRDRAVEQQFIPGPRYGRCLARRTTRPPCPSVGRGRAKAETDALEDATCKPPGCTSQIWDGRSAGPVAIPLPLGWQHINLTGDYLFTDPDALSQMLRPLGQMRAVGGTAKP